MDLLRSNRYNLGYLVNDELLDTKKIDNSIILGERHNNIDDENLLRKLIEVCKPDYVICEALGNYVLSVMSKKEHYYNKPASYHYYGRFTKHWIKISMEYDIPFVGMEYTLWEDGEYDKLTLRESFEVREKHFISIIDGYSSVGKVIAICGDTHLRTVYTETLGNISPLYKRYKNSKTIIRSRYGEIE